MRHMLVRVGWKPDFVEKSVPVLPISGWMGDNLIKKSTNMTWWSGCDVEAVDGKKIHVDTLLEALNNFVQVRAVGGRGWRRCGEGGALPPYPFLRPFLRCRWLLRALGADNRGA